MVGEMNILQINPLSYQGLDIYIKVKHLEEDNLLVLSFHEAEKPFVFRF